MVCDPQQTSVSLNVETFPFPDSNETRIKINTCLWIVVPRSLFNVQRQENARINAETTTTNLPALSVVVRHLETSTLEAALDIEALIDFGAVENRLRNHVRKKEILQLRSKEEGIPYNTQPSPQHNPTSE